MGQLTIFIPSYNRTELLIESLKKYIQYVPLNIEIKILDNHSDIPIIDVVQCYPEINKRVQIIRNSFNVGLCTNLILPFLYCNTDYLLVIGDDDILNESAIDIIIDTINKNFNIPPTAFFFNVKNIRKYQLTNSFEDLINIKSTFGEILWIGGIVYNVKRIRPYLQYGLHNQHLYTPHLIAVFKALENGDSILFTSLKISSNNNHLVDKKNRWSNTYYRLALTYFDTLRLKRGNKKTLLKKISKEELNIGLITHTAVIGNIELRKEEVRKLIFRSLIFKLKYDFKLFSVLYLFIVLVLVYITNNRILKLFNKYYFKFPQEQYE